MDSDFNWKDSGRHFLSQYRAKIAAERALKVSTFDRVVSWNGIGMVNAYYHQKRRSAWCIAFPVVDQNGAVARAHCRWPERNAEGKWEWFFHPSDAERKPISALVYGDVRTARQAFSFESQWDDLTLLETLDLFDQVEAGEVAMVCTRGANFADRLRCLPWREDVTIYAVPQNDPAGRKWLTDHGCLKARVYILAVKEPYKDLNQWLKEGNASSVDIDPLLECAPVLESSQSRQKAQSPPEGEPSQGPSLYEELRKDFAQQGTHKAAETIISVIDSGERIERINAEHHYDFDQILFRMKPEAFYGLAGEITNIIAQQCEACPEIILGQLLVMIGNQIGEAPP
jgi:hypothetical protein